MVIYDPDNYTLPNKKEWVVSEHWNQSFWTLYLVTGILKLCICLQTHQRLWHSLIPVAEPCSGRLFLVSITQALCPQRQALMQPPHWRYPSFPAHHILQQGSTTHPHQTLPSNNPCQEAGAFKRLSNNMGTWWHKVLMSTRRIYCSLSCYPDRV